MKNSSVFMKLYCFLLIGILMSCDDRRQMPVYPNPVYEAMKKSDVQLLVAVNEFDDLFNDSLFFDDKRRLVKRIRGSSKIRYEYDSVNYLTRILSISDSYVHHLIRYGWTDGVLFSYTIPIRNSSWSYSKQDLQFSETDTGRFYITNGLINAIDCED